MVNIEFYNSTINSTLQKLYWLWNLLSMYFRNPIEYSENDSLLDCLQNSIDLLLAFKELAFINLTN